MVLAPALLLLLTTLTPRPPAHLPPTDASVYTSEETWNDARHAVVSFAAVAQGYGVGRAAGLSRDGATAAALGAAVALGIGKELWDRRRSGDMSGADLAWDALGIALGAVLIGAMR